MIRKQATGRRKREIQTALFPEGLVYDQKHLFLNRFNPLLVIDTESPIDPQYIIDDEESLVGVPGRHYLNYAVRLRTVLLRLADCHSSCVSEVNSAGSSLTEPPSD